MVFVEWLHTKQTKAEADNDAGAMESEGDGGERVRLILLYNINSQ